MKRVYWSVLILLFSCLFTVGCGKTTQPTVLRIAIPYSDNILDPESNYYINWLEGQTGFDIEPVTVRQSSGKEYLDALFSSDSDIDIVMFGEQFELTDVELTDYVDSGYIYKNSHGEYYYPNYGRKAVGDCGQVLWINSEWLTTLGLPTPSTTSELKEVLKAFKEKDPNGNGKKDEIPLIGCRDFYSNNPCELILNSFVYNDPYHNRKCRNADGQEVYATDLTSFKDGILYIRDLYSEGLLDSRTFEYNHKAFCEIVNSSTDVVGAFTTDSISDVLYQGNPEIMAKFIHVAPLTGPKGVRYALKVERKPDIGAIISEKSSHKTEAETLLDLMLTKDASLIARYGEEGVDWEYSDGVDVSIYRTASTIVTKNYIWNTSQNKHLNGIGAMNVPDKYLRGVTWNGVDSDAEYIDARAQMSCEPYLTDSSSEAEYDRNLAQYVDNVIRDFIVGDREAENPIEWIKLNKDISIRSNN